MAKVKFWDDMSKAEVVEMLDKIILGIDADGSAKYADVAQLAAIMDNVATFEYINSSNGILNI